MAVSTNPPRNGREKPLVTPLDLSWSYSNNEELLLLSQICSIWTYLDPFFLFFVYRYLLS